MGSEAESTTATVEITMKPGSEGYKQARVINRLKRDSRVADVEWLDRPTVDDEEVDDGGQ